jgi:hypothetical protein
MCLRLYGKRAERFLPMQVLHGCQGSLLLRHNTLLLSFGQYVAGCYILAVLLFRYGLFAVCGRP